MQLGPGGDLAWGSAAVLGTRVPGQRGGQILGTTTLNAAKPRDWLVWSLPVPVGSEGSCRNIPAGPSGMEELQPFSHGCVPLLQAVGSARKGWGNAGAVSDARSRSRAPVLEAHLVSIPGRHPHSPGPTPRVGKQLHVVPGLGFHRTGKCCPRAGEGLVRDAEVSRSRALVGRG